MAVSYKKLYHLLIDRKMKKIDLEVAANLTHYQMYKLANGKNITTDVIEAICNALNVGVQDILEFVPDGTSDGCSADDPAKEVERDYYMGIEE
jgi:Predicted transcriptional regulator